MITVEYLISQLENHVAYDMFEEIDRKYCLEFIKKEKYEAKALYRHNILGHFCASAFIVNKERTKMVVVKHNIFGAWIYPGGHTEYGSANLLSVAKSEAKEETGLNVKVLDPKIFFIEVCPVKSHIRKGEYVPAHVHLDAIFLFEADDKIPLVCREDESSGIRWVDFKDADDETMCDFIRPVHRRLINKLETLQL